MIEFNDGYGEEENLDEDSEEYKQKVRELNDEFRRTFNNGLKFVTNGVQSLGPEAIQEIFHKVKTFDKFTPDNDPYEEHDFGSFQYTGHTINWKIDYYDSDLKFHSPNKADPKITTRVLTIMLAGE